MFCPRVLITTIGKLEEVKIKGDDISWEQTPLETIASEKQLAAYRHDGFWQPMDTLRDKMYLEKLWASSNPPWKVWK